MQLAVSIIGFEEKQDNTDKFEITNLIEVQ
jgi:hypothetical protein